MKVGDRMQNTELSQEIDRLKSLFPGADENKFNALEGLIEQAAYERIYLKRLNEQAIVSGLVKIHPDNPSIQKSLPISAEISKHSAAFTHIMDKLMKHLAIDLDDEGDGLDEYE